MLRFRLLYELLGGLHGGRIYYCSLLRVNGLIKAFMLRRVRRILDNTLFFLHSVRLYFFRCILLVGSRVLCFHSILGMLLRLVRQIWFRFNLSFHYLSVLLLDVLFIVHRRVARTLLGILMRQVELLLRMSYYLLLLQRRLLLSVSYVFLRLLLVLERPELLNMKRLFWYL